ncbi:MAG: DUF92 domain-containing protein, partial [Rhodanobacteraceae bacterium]
LPATLLSRAGKRSKRELVDVGKHGARDATQVFANGGVAALCALGSLAFGEPLNAAFAGALAAAAADTWGTEIGTLAKRPARSILTLRPIATGLSGGITFAGTLAEAGGALVVALVALAAGVAGPVPILIAGIVGAFADSLLGASLQGLRFCPRCKRRCETDPHVCGTRTTIVRGAAWMTNDAVNVTATLAGAICAGALARYWP